MSDQRFIKAIQLAATVAMSIAVIMMFAHLAFNWLAYGDGEKWYYATTLSLQVFFLLIQLWIIRLRRQNSQP